MTTFAPLSVAELADAAYENAWTCPHCMAPDSRYHHLHNAYPSPHRTWCRQGRRPLTIDPVVTYCTYCGAEDSDDLGDCPANSGGWHAWTSGEYPLPDTY